ncbi:MAG: hypothetical protein H6581_11025 [Bacteroidia bacterium]|nr:hypothetical protein [Bacteroidia bacterium]
MEKQIVVVEDTGTKFYLHYPDQESEVIDAPNPLLGKTRRMERGKIMAELFSRLVRQGYVLVGTNNIPNIGATYLFEGQSQTREMEF